MITTGVYVLLFGLWVLAPLIPSILIYRIFPGSTITAQGPLAGLTVRASGAVAFYLVLFAASWSMINHMIIASAVAIDTDQHGYWEFVGPIELQDTNHRPVAAKPGATISFVVPADSPDFDGSNIKVWVRRTLDGFPRIQVQLHNPDNTIAGTGYLPIPIDLEPDNFNRKIPLSKPTTIQVASGISF
jgi:hypothetical protein